MTGQERISVYIDGFNVYYGFKRKGWERYLWLDYRAVFERLVRPGQELVEVNYFTALSNRDGSRQRQQTYLNAIDVQGGVTVHSGRIESRPIRCKKCGKKSHNRQQEKETDVSMAVRMLTDSFEEQCDSIWLMTNDSDLVPAVKALVARNTKVVIVRPPTGTGVSAGDELVQASGNRELHVGRSIWAQSQLPEEVQRQKGQRRHRRPETWT